MLSKEAGVLSSLGKLALFGGAVGLGAYGAGKAREARKQYELGMLLHKALAPGLGVAIGAPAGSLAGYLAADKLGINPWTSTALGALGGAALGAGGGALYNYLTSGDIVVPWVNFNR